MQSPSDPQRPTQPFSSTAEGDPSATPPAQGPAAPEVSSIFAANASANHVTKNGARMAVTPSTYQPSGRISEVGLPILIVWALLLGVIAGYGYWLATKQGSPLLFTQIVLGIVLGVALIPAVALAKCRNKRIAIVTAVAATCVTFLIWHSLQAMQLRREMIAYATVVGARANVPPSQARLRAESALTPLRSAKYYLRQATVFGVTLREDEGSRLRGSGGGMRVNGVWYWVLHAFEVLLTVLMAAGIAQARAGKRFSEQRNCWYRKKTLCFVPPGRLRELVPLLQAGQWQQAGVLARSYRSQDNSGAAITIYDCPPQSDGVVTITTDVNNQTHFVFESPASSEQIAALRNAL